MGLRSCIGALAGLALLLGLGGCSVWPSAGPSVTAFDLLPPPGPAIADAAGERVLMLELPDSAAGFASEAMVYRRSGQALERFATGRWSAPPARLLAEAAQTALERSGRFRAVVQEPTPVRADLRLHLTLMRLEQDYRRSDTGIARVALRFRLLDAAGGELLAAGIIEDSATAGAAGPAGFANAAGIATRRLLTSLDQRIAEALDHATPPAP